MFFLLDLFLFSFFKLFIIRVLAPGGWREEEFSQCHGKCGGIKSKLKYCDRPEPSYRLLDGVRHRTGKKCPCNSTDSTEVFCDGLRATIDKPCNEELCE